MTAARQLPTKSLVQGPGYDAQTGVTKTNSLRKQAMTEAEFNGLEADEASERVSKAEAVFQKVYTEFILASVAELPSLLDSESL